MSTTNSSDRYDVAVLIGRFQPFHRGHLGVIRRAFEVADRVLILVGSAHCPRSHRNPFTFEERADMILAAITDEFGEDGEWSVDVEPLDDHTYNNQRWIAEVQEIVASTTDENDRITLIGHSKDHTSYYLSMFPQWASVDVENVDGISSTPIREAFFTSGDILAAHIPESTTGFLREFATSDAYSDLTAEYRFIEKYRKQWAEAPYAPTFVTVDACVVQSGHVLLVKRRGQPGRGLWALPGGFLEQNETIESAVLRELREETRLKVPEPVLRGSIVTSRVFDDPNRSARGRTITHAFLIHLKPDVRLPEVRAGSDARAAEWVPISEVDREKMFEDHYAIVAALVALL